MVAHVDKFKEYGLTAADIIDNATSTKDLKFTNIEKLHTNEKISGAHTKTSAGRYVHIELEKLLESSISYSDYVAKVRKWADEFLNSS